MNPTFSFRRFITGFTVLLGLTLALRTGYHTSAQSDGNTTTREDMIRIADRYETHTWTATTSNVLHETRFYNNDWWQIDTPDNITDSGKNLTPPGWWVEGTNVGVPGKLFHALKVLYKELHNGFTLRIQWFVLGTKKES